jgi:hypothetical protein
MRQQNELQVVSSLGFDGVSDGSKTMQLRQNLASTLAGYYWFRPPQRLDSVDRYIWKLYRLEEEIEKTATFCSESRPRYRTRQKSQFDMKELREIRIV